LRMQAQETRQIRRCRIGRIQLDHRGCQEQEAHGGGRVAHVEARWHNECSRPRCVSRSNTMFAIKAEIRDLRAKSFAFNAQKTMYGGKRIAKGDTVFIFASENEGGPGLISRGVVTSA